MLFMMIIPVYAAEGDWEIIDTDPSITIVNTSKNHTYNAYQIFTGQLARMQRVVPDPKDTSDEPAVYPEYSIKTNNSQIHIYLKDDKYYLVSNGEEYQGSTAKATPVYEQSLRSLEWGSGITDDGIIALYQQYVDATAQVPDVLPAGKTLREYLQEYFEAEDVAQKIRGTEDSGAVKFANFISAGGNGKVYLGSVAATANGDGGTAKLELTEQGYYMITETASNNTTIPDSTSESIAYSRYIVRVAGTVVLEPKSDAPRVIKKVYDNHSLSGLNGDAANEDAMIPGFDLDSGSTSSHTTQNGIYPAHPDGTSGGWNDVADYSIGDAVPFKIVGTLPNTYTGYYNYKYVIHDTLAAGYTIIPSTIHMYVVDGDSQTMIELAPAATGGNVTWDAKKDDEDATRLNITIGNTKLIDINGSSKEDVPENQLINENSKIVVEYAATLNYKANVGTAGNEGSVYLEFSNNPNPSSVITTSKTPKDEVVVYTYMVEGVKIAAQQQSQTNLTLAGAEFKLRREDKKWYKLTKTENAEGETVYDVTWVSDEESASIITSNGSGLFDYKGLDDGTYYLKEVVAPFGYILPTDEFKFALHADIDNSQSYNGIPTSVWASGKKVTAITEGSYQSQFSAHVDNNQTVILTVTNSEQSQLPITGGVGVYIIYGVGISLIIVTSTLLIVKKRKESK